jgi:hypothetical protein
MNMSNLADILFRAGFGEDKVGPLLKLGFYTPEAALTFLKNHPSIERIEVLKLFGLRWRPDEAAAIRQGMIDAIERSGFLAPNFLDLENRQEQRFDALPLGATVLNGKGTPEDQDHVAEAISFVSAVESHARQTRLQMRDLPDHKIDLLGSRAWRARDQGSWPACVPFSLAACIELARALSSGGLITPTRQSARFLYRQARREAIQGGKVASPAYRTGGLKFEDVELILSSYGSCREIFCQDAYFEDADTKNDLAAWKAAANEITDKSFQDAQTKKFLMERFDFPKFTERRSGMARTICDWLKQGCPVAIAIAGFADPLKEKATIWHSEAFWEYGILPIPAPHTIVGTGGHAVCIVGYVPELPNASAVPTAENFYRNEAFYNNLVSPGYFVFRNSYDIYFPRKNLALRSALDDANFPEGYGLIPAAVIEYFVWEYGIVKPVP